MFWGYALFGKLLKLRGMKQPRPGLLKVLFPEGVGTFLIACSRTSTLLASYAFMFWVLVGLGAVTRQVRPTIRPGCGTNALLCVEPEAFSLPRCWYRPRCLPRCLPV